MHIYALPVMLYFLGSPSVLSHFTVPVMAPIKLTVCNVRGMCARPKRLALFSQLKAMRADVIVLLETHLTGQLQLALKKQWIGWVYRAPHTPHSRGVAILISKHVQFQLLTLKTDPQDKYIFVHAMNSRFEYLMSAYYVPPVSIYSVA